MVVIVSMVMVGGSVVVGYTMHHGDLAVLWQPNEVVIICGCAFGAVVIGNTPATVKAMFVQALALLKPDPYGRQSFQDLLQVLYGVFYAARKDGLVGIESHVESPHESELFNQYPSFANNHHAVSFLADTLKVLLTGAVEDHQLSDVLEIDLDHLQPRRLQEELLQWAQHPVPG